MMKNNKIKGYWIICTESYEIDGIQVKKGSMSYYDSTQPLQASKWRKATTSEIESYKAKLF